MVGTVPRAAAYICRVCRLQPKNLSPLLYPSKQQDKTIAKCTFSREQRRTASTRIPNLRASKVVINETKIQPKSSPKPVLPHAGQTAQHVQTTTSETPMNTDDIRGSLREIQVQVNAICSSMRLPEEVRILEVMDKAYQLSNLLVFGQTTAPDEEITRSEEEDPTSDNLFSELDEPSESAKRPKSHTFSATSALPTSYRERSAEALSETLYTLLKDPKTLISEPVLSTYVRIICQLGNPEYLPEIFFLYANKPQPIPGSIPVRYRNPSPSAAKNAVPQGLSDVALDTAILQRDLALAVAVIDTTVGTRAFRVNKFIRKASLPLAFVASTPVAAYAAADWVANWQNSLDPDMAKAITLMGSAAYIGTLTTIGFVAVTTWNDHHERVRWTEGTPLRQRWMREEERLYFDRIAMAWGFQRKRRRGEEMGDLWEELREECGARGMVLDKSELLPGMQ